MPITAWLGSCACTGVLTCAASGSGATSSFKNPSKDDVVRVLHSARDMSAAFGENR